jgi:adenylate cyclase
MSQTRRLAAILAADVAGYSRLMGADEDRTLERLKALRRELVDPKIAEQHGRIVKTAGGGVDIAYSPPIGSERTRIRESSSTAMHPRCNVALKVGRDWPATTPPVPRDACLAHF